MQSLGFLPLYPKKTWEGTPNDTVGSFLQTVFGIYTLGLRRDGRWLYDVIWLYCITYIDYMITYIYNMYTQMYVFILHIQYNHTHTHLIWYMNVWNFLFLTKPESNQIKISPIFPSLVLVTCLVLPVFCDHETVEMVNSYQQPHFAWCSSSCMMGPRL